MRDLTSARSFRNCRLIDYWAAYGDWFGTILRSCYSTLQIRYQAFLSPSNKGNIGTSKLIWVDDPEA